MHPNHKHVVMVASENGALSGGKVGGVGDVIRDLPRALAEMGWSVTTIIPSYGFLHRQNKTLSEREIVFPFGGHRHTALVRRVDHDGELPGITHLLVDHPDIKGNPIYFNDPPETPFLRDSAKYAMFCSAVGQLLKTVREPYFLHLHDWHAATLLLLAELHPEFSHLREVHTAFTIHNLSIQGTRPMRNHPSSLEGWFPELFKSTGWVSLWQDLRYYEPCYTPMAVGIRFADKINTVSPTYAREILRASDPSTGAFRGEGLEKFLQNAAAGNRLFGILNGCEYPSPFRMERLDFSCFADAALKDLEHHPDKFVSGELDESVFRLQGFREHKPEIILTCVTRIVEQKVRLFFQECADGVTAIDHLVRMLEERNGIFVVLGSGVAEYEEAFRKYCNNHRRIVFLKGYFEHTSHLLYANGDLFLMPSLFEPCGISQMIAMREGQPCVVHAVGGLKDTVIDMENGFTFWGNSLPSAAQDFVSATDRAMHIFSNEKPQWEDIKAQAKAARFTWEQSAREYIELMYAE